MAAGLVAQDLGLPLHQVDLSQIESKWLGETEKNLATLFDAAEACHAVILFDEADALFAKRTEVQTSNDRHANRGVNYLLQRIERFTGVCILTTNHETAVDEAFGRRLAVHIRFDLPDQEQRFRLWRSMLPDAAAVDADVDLVGLAQRFEMAGGNIRNAVVRAAFMATDRQRAIDKHPSSWRRTSSTRPWAGSCVSHTSTRDLAMRPDLRFVDPAPSRLRGPRRRFVTEPETPGDAPEPIPTASEPDEPAAELAIEVDLVRVLLEPIAPGEPPSTGFARKEATILSLLETLSAANATLLHDRLATAREGDVLAAAFARLKAERRARLLDRLRDAPRREFLRRARWTRVP
jgi:SpoVK/Ycf46/Vps4 family AAA+-type ATPase